MSEDDSKVINWGEEVENLSESGDGTEYWTPEQGKQEVKFLDEGEEYRDKKKFDDNERDYVKFRVEVDGEEYIWDLAKGSTPGSKFGQIARYAKQNGGLEGETVTWFRQGEGQQTNHLLLELSSDDSSDDDGQDVIFDDEEDEG